MKHLLKKKKKRYHGPNICLNWALCWEHASTNTLFIRCSLQGTKLFVYCFPVCYDLVDSNKAKYHRPSTQSIFSLPPNMRWFRPNPFAWWPLIICQICMMTIDHWCQSQFCFCEDLQQKFADYWLAMLLGWESMMISLWKKTNDGSSQISQWMDWNLTIYSTNAHRTN